MARRGPSSITDVGRTSNWSLTPVSMRAAKSHIDFYLSEGLMRKSTIGGLPHADGSVEAMKRYAAKAGNAQDEFGRPTAAEWTLREPRMGSVVFVGDGTSVVRFTMGWVLINEDARVLNKEHGVDQEVGEPIDGLWAAGEVAGGVRGPNRLGGSSLLECVDSGRRAGRGVVKYLRDLEGK
ncbi:uncharacterized protein EI97DRAFT_462734 [Westerdykella ornata]|uniref:FAD-dependent oxidoreductase 2 FAD-binding domain-containing protein n=1 Tax=Westerdykella ornata TaxID=318751 RepID=A0A6A6J586_WESOR|nr:uncharacterized protein EI97DRAFT_462734 [Westerdykella ornata]KAF2271552.1 hypothetical protein EI97DRAFT_462734 [Westerdykella ornata]